METQVKMMMKHVADKKRLGRVVGEGGIYDESANRRAYSQSRVCSLSPCGANRVTTERPLMCLLPPPSTGPRQLHGKGHRQILRPVQVK